MRLGGRNLLRRRTGAGPIRPIPSRLPAGEIERELKRYDDWFYEFGFANGAMTAVDEPLVRQIHETRARLVFDRLDRAFGKRWRRVACLDMACHQGWFAIQAALRGARVRGVDARPEHIDRARLVATLAGLEGIDFDQRNLYEIAPDRDGSYDLTLLLGVLYHLENPVGALRAARSVTTELCVIETQVARPASDLSYAWGTDPNLRSGHAMAVGRVDPHHAAETEAVVLLPTLAALHDLLRAAGFARIELAEPPASATRQFVEGDRVVIFASV